MPIGKFLTMVNSVFTTNGRLSKRNGFPRLTDLPNANQTTITTLNDNLLATGSNLYAYSEDADQWLNQGLVQPVQLDVQSLVRSTTEQRNPDAAVSSTGLTCLVYTDNDLLYYQVSDSETGQQIVSRTLIEDGVASPRVFLLNRYFIITYIADVSGATHLQYIAVPISTPATPLAAVDISTTLTTQDAGYDGYVANNSLYLAWDDTGPAVNVVYLSSTLVLQTPVQVAADDADLVSVTADNSGNTPVIYVTWWNTTSDDGFTASFDQILAPILAPTAIFTNTEINELTSVANDDTLHIFAENSNDYASPYPVGSVRTDYVTNINVTSAGTVSLPSTVLRSVGLASKAFIGPNDEVYMLVAYGETAQPSYFLINDTGDIIMRLAYSNGGGYADTQVLPSVSQIEDSYYIPYLIKDFLAPVNKGTDLPSGTRTTAIYTQTGVNVAIFTINATNQQSSEIAQTLHLTGGQLWMYDGVKPVEHGFHVWPENVQLVQSNGSGTIANGTYFYVFTYEWTDNQGNLHRSAPSVPEEIVTTGANDTVTCYVPTLRLTYKTDPNPVRIVGYRWSQAQQTYYQFTSITDPTYNDTTVDYVAIVDTEPDVNILGNTLLYTTGGVIENIAAPASIDSTLYKNRLFLIDAENPNLLWYSKPVLQNTPVEMSDLFTFFVAPTSGAQGSTGPMKCVSSMDDKLILFKKDAIYYITGIGPDVAGANNDFNDPVFITSAVGCSNPNSIVLTPNGLMFQSDKGIWLLRRDLGAEYIGSPVENYNDIEVMSALSVPGTTQVRFTLANGVDLMYDYFQQQWGTFTNVQAISACLFHGAHTYLTQNGMVNQETPGRYVDGGGTPVLLSFTTSWINIAGLQGYERFYFMYLLGNYYSPFMLNVSLAYDYNSSASHNTIVTPDNATGAWGDEAQWGSGEAWGGTGRPFEARVFPEQQKCQSFQVTVQEVYDSVAGETAGQGLSLSGLNLVIGAKKGYRTQKASRSFG